MNEDIRKHAYPIGVDEFSGDLREICQPLIAQPGEIWQYGVNIDFASLAVERATGMSLNDYFHKNIFEPLGLKSISLFPNEDMKKRLAYMNQRTPSGVLIGREHLLRKPLMAKSSEIKDILNSGGAGAFATATDYARTL